MADHGGCLVICSSDLDEVLRLANRILVMAGGRVTQELTRRDATKARLLQAVGSP